MDGDHFIAELLNVDGVGLDVEGLGVLPVFEDVDNVGGLDLDLGLPLLLGPSGECLLSGEAVTRELALERSKVASLFITIIYIRARVAIAIISEAAR